MTGPTISLLLLLEHLRNHYEVSVLLPGEDKFSEALDGERIPFYSLRSLTKWSIPTITRLIQRGRFSLVYGNNYSSSSRSAFIAAKLSRRPFVCHLQEMVSERDWRNAGYLRFAHAAIAVSHASAASVARFVPNDRLHVVHNGVPLSNGMADRQSARALLMAQTGLAPEDALVVGIGHVCPRKGQTFAVEAIAKVIERIPTVRLILVGSLERDKSYVNEVRSQIRAMNLEKHVFLAGTREDITSMLSGADIFLHTALADPHPRTVMEAMAARLPVVAFATDGVVETVTDRQSGFLIQRGDTSGLAEAISQLVTDSGRRAQFGDSGRRRAEEHFSAQATGTQISQIIAQVLHRPS